MKPLSNGVMNVLCKYISRRPIKMLDKIFGEDIDDYLIIEYKMYLQDRFIHIWQKDELIDYANAIIPLTKEVINNLSYKDVDSDIIKVKKACQALFEIQNKYSVVMDKNHLGHPIKDIIEEVKIDTANRLESIFEDYKAENSIYIHVQQMLKNNYVNKKLKTYISKLGIRMLTPEDIKDYVRGRRYLYEHSYLPKIITNFKYIDNKELYHRELKQLDKNIYSLF